MLKIYTGQPVGRLALHVTSLVVFDARHNITGINVGRPGAVGAQLVGLGGGPRHPVILAHYHVAGAVLQQVHPGINKLLRQVIPLVILWGGDFSKTPCMLHMFQRF